MNPENINQNETEIQDFSSESSEVINKTKDFKLQMFCEINKFDETSKTIIEGNPRLSDFIQSPLQVKENKDQICNMFDKYLVNNQA